MNRVNEYRPGRNYIRVGDTVRVRPRVGRPFAGRVTEIHADDTGSITEVCVIGGPKGRPVASRTVVPSCITRMAQSRVGVSK